MDVFNQLKISFSTSGSVKAYIIDIRGREWDAMIRRFPNFSGGLMKAHMNKKLHPT